MRTLTRVIILLYLALFSCFSISVSAQTEACGTILSEEAIQFYENNKKEIQRIENEFLAQSPEARMSNAVISIPVKAHVIRTTAGFGGLSEADLNNAMANVNFYYANANLSFYLCDGINYIDSTGYYDFNSEDEDALTSAHNVPGLINIYFANSVTNSSGNGLCGYAYYPGGPDTILMNNNCAMNGSTLPHEIGHFFSLRHTHGSSNSQLTDELVNGSNCASAGDLICDTPADPQLSGSNVSFSCVYTGFQIDANGDIFDPDPTNIMSYSRKACRTYFSPGQYARMYATYLVARNHYVCQTFNADFASTTNATCNDNLTVDFTDNSVGATSWQWDVDGDNVVDYTTQNPSHTYTSAGIYDVSLTIGNGSTSISTVNFEYVQVGAQTSIPVDEDFNAITNANSQGWVNNPDGGSPFNWIANIGETPSGDTGPFGDNSPNNDGVYIYAEATGASGGSVANYVSPCIEINSLDATLEFSYHMFGETMGELHIDIDSGSGYTNDVIPALIGQQQAQQNDDYINAVVDLSSYAGQTIKVRFRAVRGFGFTSDIAIDNFQVLGTLSVNEFEASSITLYPNPTQGNVINIKRPNNNALDYKVVNLLGQTISSGTLTDNQVDVSEISSGTYFLILSGEQGSLTKKFVKQ